MKEPHILSHRQALFFLIGSVLITVSLFFGCSFAWSSWTAYKKRDPKSTIVALIQTGPEKEALSTTYLAELLQLSIDRPTTLYAFDLKRGVQNLLACPLIAEATLKRVFPGALYVDYTVRKPVALLADYRNIGIDRQGFLFPIAPFLSPKNLPELYLGLPPFGEGEDVQGRRGGCWQTPLENKHLRLAFDLLHLLSDVPWREGVRITRVDVSNAFNHSLGQREIVLFTEEILAKRCEEGEVLYLFPNIVRLGVKNYSQQLSNFFALKKKIMANYDQQLIPNPVQVSQSPIHFAPRIVDLRIPQTAFVQNS